MSKSNKPKNSKSKNNKSNIISQTADNEGIITHAIVEAYQMI